MRTSGAWAERRGARCGRCGHRPVQPPQQPARRVGSADAVMLTRSSRHGSPHNSPALPTHDSGHASKGGVRRWAHASSRRRRAWTGTGPRHITESQNCARMQGLLTIAPSVPHISPNACPLLLVLLTGTNQKLSKPGVVALFQVWGVHFDCHPPPTTPLPFRGAVCTGEHIGGHTDVRCAGSLAAACHFAGHHLESEMEVPC
mmetsp:Transcript_34742/g.103061  ORF Transcript_34742/g.103061 Transcript_34742/m.103061 type:complete len:202 (-) Transcript_34742:592-1197(-)